MMASVNDRRDMVELLLARRASVNLVDEVHHLPCANRRAI